MFSRGSSRFSTPRLGRDRRHQLHQTRRAGMRDGGGIERRFCFDDGANQRRIEIVCLRRFANHVLVRLARGNSLEIVDGDRHARPGRGVEEARLHLRRDRHGERAEKQTAHARLAARGAATIGGVRSARAALPARGGRCRDEARRCRRVSSGSPIAERKPKAHVASAFSQNSKQV